MPQSSISGMAAMMPCGMPGTIIFDGRAVKGKGISEPIITNG